MDIYSTLKELDRALEKYEQNEGVHLVQTELWDKIREVVYKLIEEKENG